ncbi:MAG: alpha/beta hydrolase [Acidobacteria bacterium]|nr:alpha/beta hydrolase [Acidobacteriota bacterium]
MPTLKIRVIYPLQGGRIVLRTDVDWNRDVEAVAVSPDRTVFEFSYDFNRPYFYFKPCVIDQNGFHWAVGTNYLAVMDTPGGKDIYPHFFTGTSGTISDPIDFYSQAASGSYRVRVYFPPGYEENTLKRYPVIYMHDGNNLFFPAEAFMGSEWRVDETMDRLDSMNIIDDVIAVGIYPRDRMNEYTKPGYETYGRFVADELKRKVDSKLRTLPTPDRTAVMGSSLGGVVSLYLAWQRPDAFGKAACLSSTFGYRDDLFERVASEPKRNVELYIDSGWPQDNYEVGRSMRDLLVRRGYEFGKDLLYFAFPDALHNEASWASRSHIPFQFFFGKTPRL